MLVTSYSVKEGFSEQVTWREKGVRRVVLHVSERKPFQAERTTSTKTVRQECTRRGALRPEHLALNGRGNGGR